VYAMQTQELALMRFTQRADEGDAVDAAWPVYRDTGAASTAVVYFELPPGAHLATHTDSAEEVLVVLDGEIEAVVGDERGRVAAGGIAVVPAMVPHGAVNVGATTARVAGVFPSNTVVSVFDHAFDQTGGRVVGTPAPADDLATATAA
jgi:quercetin dioxygenase-like cupin family protein